MHARAVLQGAYTGNVPASVDWFTGVSLPMDLNDAIGDCTIADEAHAVGIFTAKGQGTEVVLSNSDVLKVYERVSGYNPGNPQTDVGCVIQDVLNDWRKIGIGSPAHQILAFFQVDYTDPVEMRACTWLFLGVTLGVNLPQSAMDAFNAGQTWDYVPTANNRIVGGHDVRIVGYNTDGTWQLATWGTVVKATWAWIQRFAEEAWAQADPEIVKNHAAPNGLSDAALNAAFTQVTGQPGPFVVTPTPPGPSPTPTPPTPTPTPPMPVVDPADKALVAATGPWAAQSWHPWTQNIANAINTWRRAKGL